MTASKSDPPPCRLIALDVGLRSIGVAVSDLLRLTARPLTTLKRGSLRADSQRIQELLREYSATTVVVGMPRHLNGAVSSTSETIRPLAQALQEAGVTVIWQDERLSTKLAEEWMARSRVPIKQRRALRDEYAAALILQWYLEEQE